MLHIEFQASKPSGSEDFKRKIFEYFSMYFYDLDLGSPGVRPSWTLRSSFEQS